MFLDHNGMIGLALLRSRRDGPCQAETLRDFARLRHQLARSIRVQMALDGEAAELMVGDTSSLGSATILLDRHGGLCALSECAEQLLDDTGPLRLDGLSLRLSEPAEDRPFQQALARLLRSDGHRDVLVHQVQVGRRRDRRRRGWDLVAVRLPQRPHGLGFEPQLAITLKAAGSGRDWQPISPV